VPILDSGRFTFALFLRQAELSAEKSLPEVIADWQQSSDELRTSMDAFFETLSDVQ